MCTVIIMINTIKGDHMDNSVREPRIYTITAFLMVLLFCIPAVGLIASCVMSFTMKNKNARALARAFMIIHLIIVCLAGFAGYHLYKEVYIPYKSGGIEQLIPNVTGTRYESIAATALGMTDEQMNALRGLDDEQKDAALTGDFSALAAGKINDAVKAYAELRDITMTVGMPAGMPNIFSGKPVETVREKELYHVYGTKPADFAAACSALEKLGYFDMGSGTDTDNGENYTWHYYVSKDAQTQITLSKGAKADFTAVEIKGIAGSYITSIGSNLPDALNGHLISEVTEGMGASKTTTYTVHNVTKEEAENYFSIMADEYYVTFSEDMHGEYHLSGKDYCSLRYDVETSALIAIIYTAKDATVPE